MASELVRLSTLETRQGTRSGETKVKVAGVMVSEEPAPVIAGQMRGARAAAAAANRGA